jgi:hypothetical protein
VNDDDAILLHCIIVFSFLTSRFEDAKRHIPAACGGVREVMNEVNSEAMNAE